MTVKGLYFHFIVPFLRLEVLYERQPWDLVQPVKTRLLHAPCNPEQLQTQPKPCPACAPQWEKLPVHLRAISRGSRVSNSNTSINHLPQMEEKECWGQQADREQISAG